MLCRYNDNIKKCTAIPLSKDHCPTQYEERIRIQKAGGQVRYPRLSRPERRHQWSRDVDRKCDM